MQGVINDFEDRVKEVNLYFETLDQFYEVGTVVKICKIDQEDEARSINLDPDFLKILKANTFLMIYNLIESSISAGILTIYKELEVNSYSFDRVREEIQEIWLNYHYRTVYDANANFHSYKKQAKKLVQMAIEKTTIKLDRNAMGISGNLDAEQIRKICDIHGISKAVSPECKGGVDLQIVREKRNALAHGSLSFVECGREFTENDLKEIKNQAVVFVRDILNNIKLYIDNAHFDIAYAR